MQPGDSTYHSGPSQKDRIGNFILRMLWRVVFVFILMALGRLYANLSTAGKVRVWIVAAIVLFASYVFVTYVDYASMSDLDRLRLKIH